MQCRAAITWQLRHFLRLPARPPTALSCGGLLPGNCRVFALVGSEPSRAAPYRRPSLFADCCRLLRRPPIRGDSRLWSRPGRLSVSLPALRLRQFLRLRRAHPPPFGRWVPFFFINKRPSVRFAISGAAARGVSRPAAAFYYGAPPLCPGLRVVKKQERPLPLLLIV